MPNKIARKRLHRKTPKKLVTLIRASTERKVSCDLGVNISYISNLTSKGIEPTDQTEKGRAVRVKLFLPEWKHPPRRMTPKHMSNNDAAQSWTLWMRELVKSLRTPTPKELAKALKPRNRIGRFEDGKVR